MRTATTATTATNGSSSVSSSRCGQQGPVARLPGQVHAALTDEVRP